MLGLITIAAAFASLAATQQTSFKPGTGQRSLWIPFQTVSGTPLASIAGHNTLANATTYVLSCPTASPQCALAPNLTVTEAPSAVEYATSNTAGEATISCTLTGTTEATCLQRATADSNVDRTSTTLGATQISYQAVDVTATLNNTSTMPQTVTVTETRSSTSSTSTSTAAAVTAGWGMGGAVGAGLVALAAL